MTIRQSYTPLGAGVDLITPEPQMNPSSALVAVNYECPLEGGFQSIPGYTKYDADVVPGQGDVLGVAVFKDKVLAIRENAGGGAATLHESSGAGWTAVTGATTMPVGRYDFDIGNFSAQSFAETIFMQCYDSGKPYSYDGSTFAQLTNAPSGGRWIKAHQNHLFVAFGTGSLQFSSLGDATDWQAINGAGEIGMSDQINGLELGPGQALVVGCQKTIQAVYGKDSSSFQREILSTKTGVREYSLAALGQDPVFVNDRGLTSLSATQAYGNFLPVPVGAVVDPFWQTDNIKVVLPVRSKNQVRMFKGTSNGIIATAKPGAGLACTVFEYPDIVACAGGAKLSDESELLVAGFDDGYVRQLDEGTSFDGANIQTFLTLAYNNFKSPTTRKRFRRAWVDLKAGANTTLNVTPGFDYGSPDIATHRTHFLSALASGGLWGRDNWDEFAWSAALVNDTVVDVAGTAESFNLALYSSSSTAQPHSVVGYTTHYTPRRISRS